MYIVKAFFAFIILVFVFAAGVWVGKLSSWWHVYKAHQYNGHNFKSQQYPDFQKRLYRLDYDK